MSSIAFNTGKNIINIFKNIHSIAAIDVPIQKIAYFLKSIAIMSGVMYYCFPKFPARNNGCFKADIEILDIVVKEKLGIYTPFNS